MHREYVWRFTMKQSFKHVRQIIKRNRKQILLFELLYKGLLALIMLPLLEVSLRYAILFSGYSYVTPENIFYVLRKPSTILIVTALFVFCLLFSFIEQISLYQLFEISEHSHALRLEQLLFLGAGRALQMLKSRRITGLLFGTFLFFAVSNLPLWIALYLRFSALRFLLREAYSIVWLRYCLSLFFVALLLLGILGIFSMQYCYATGCSYLDGMKKSICLLRKNRWKHLRTLWVWNTKNLLLEVIWYTALFFLFTLLGYLLLDPKRRLAALLIMEDSWNLYGGILATTYGVVASSAMLSHLFYVEHAQTDKKTTEGCEERLYEKNLYEKNPYGENLYGKKQKVLLRLLIPVIMAGNMITIALLFWNGSFLDREVLKETAITAHRGASGEAPENTISALLAAMDQMADYAEIDVQETADGELVLMHDYSLRRTTGMQGFVSSTTLEELKSYDCGSWFSPEFQGERVPTLEEALSLCKGKIYLNIELKGTKNKEELSRKVVQLIEEYDFEQQCVVTSVHRDMLMKVKELNDAIKTGYIMSLAYGNFYEADGIDFFSIKSSYVDQKVVKNAHRLGKEIHVWTVNSRSELERIKLLGVDNIITDNPIYAREIIESEEISATIFEWMRILFEN